jgi:hypothetical protein
MSLQTRSYSQIICFQRANPRLLLLVVASLFGAFIAVGFSISVDISNLYASKSQLTDWASQNLRFWDGQRPTDEIYKSNDGILHGKYIDIRKTLDYNFHTVYTRERVQLQDLIIDSVLEEFPIDNDRQNCSDTPWIVFTAGAMGAGKVGYKLGHKFLFVRFSTCPLLHLPAE